MALTPGTRLGVYEITASIGEGGMGQVYRARDTKLDRDVAIKILPDVFAHDADRLARFQREAKTLASLNHPNIAAIYGLEESGDVTALVMELVEGEDLSQRIAQGAIPLDEALPIAKQIAEALEAAHEQGIIHRDLKPANIKVRPDGTVKVLDFGLAKAMEPMGATAPGLSMSPTITTPAMTQAGMILGTAAYMSPEQARARTVDKRTDIWAFGCVLFEMVTAKRAFDGGDISETLALILTSEPDWTALPENTPVALQRLLVRTLKKNRRERLADIADAGLEIKEALSAPSVPDTLTIPAPPRWSGRMALALVAVVLVLVVAAAGALTYVRPAPADIQPIRVLVSPPTGWNLSLFATATGQSLAPLAVSPDGRHLAFVASSADGISHLWIRSLDSIAAEELGGTEGASSPFWSPDSRFVAFFAAATLKKVALAGGPPLTVCNAPEFRGGTWSRDGVILFATTAQSALQKVSASGGVPTPATTLAPGETGHWRPSFLPDGRHFIYRVSNGGIYAASLDSTERTVIIEKPDGNNALYAQGHLLFLREATLMAQPFDTARLVLTGEPAPIADQIQTMGNPPTGVFAVSETGVLAYVTGNAGAVSQLRWLDRTGARSALVIDDNAAYGNLALSPDAKRAIVSIRDPVRRLRDLWLVDMARGLRSRFTFEPSELVTAIWSPDGARVVFNSLGNARMNLYQRAASGTGTEELLLEEGLNKTPWSWSPDGRFIMFSSDGDGTAADLMVLPVLGDKKPFPFVRTRFVETRGQFSPDGRWVVYESNESGLIQVYVAPFPGAGGKAQLSTGAGSWPRWRRDGKEIFYIAANNRLMAVTVNGEGAGFEVGPERFLFALRTPVAGSPYDVAPDGQRFMVNVLPDNPASSQPITLTVNWLEGLNQ